MGAQESNEIKDRLQTPSRISYTRPNDNFAIYSMTYKITIASDPSVSFEADENDSILNAAHNAGIDIPSCCENGICATCKGCILKGDINYPEQEPEGLMEDEAQDGQALFCCAHPTSDLTIDHPELLLPGEFPARFFKVSLANKSELGPLVTGFSFKIESKIPFRFLPGQYIELIVGTQRHPLSIVNQPGDEFVECHISSSHDREDILELVQQIETAEKLMIHGPLGRAYFRDNRDGDIVFVAGGGGITPMLSMLKPALETGRPVHFYWGTRTADHFYQREKLEALANSHPSLTLSFAVSDASNDFDGPICNIHECLLNDLAKLSAPTIYMAGPAPMITATHKALIEQGIMREQMISDAFSYLNI